MNDFFENYLLKQLNINRLKISDDFSFTQICKIISKGLKLESYESLIKSLCLEKGNFFVNKNISSSDIKENVDSFLKKTKKSVVIFLKVIQLIGSQS